MVIVGKYVHSLNYWIFQHKATDIEIRSNTPH